MESGNSQEKRGTSSAAATVDLCIGWTLGFYRIVEKPFNFGFFEMNELLGKSEGI